jgi:release factor glutamine methyltransferase
MKAVSYSSPAPPESDTIAALLTEAQADLASRHVGTPRLDAEVLLSHILQTDRTSLYTRLQRPLSAAHKRQFADLITRRKQREPLAYITGSREFWSLEFHVDKHVLIPRPETEIVVHTALRLLHNTALATPGILDMGTGSGCIGVALATELPQAAVWALDIEDEALALARQNARHHAVDERLTFCQGDLFAPISHLTERFHLIVTNPPYIDRETVDTLQPEVRLWEPQRALDGGQDGLDFYRRLLYDSPNYIRPGGWLVMEIGHDQRDAILQLAQAQCHLSIQNCVQDYAGHDRVVVFQRAA